MSAASWLEPKLTLITFSGVASKLVIRIYPEYCDEDQFISEYEPPSSSPTPVYLFIKAPIIEDGMLRSECFWSDSDSGEPSSRWSGATVNEYLEAWGYRGLSIDLQTSSTRCEDYLLDLLRDGHKALGFRADSLDAAAFMGYKPIEISGRWERFTETISSQFTEKPDWDRSSNRLDSSKTNVSPEESSSKMSAHGSMGVREHTETTSITPHPNTMPGTYLWSAIKNLH